MARLGDFAEDVAEGVKEPAFPDLPTTEVIPTQGPTPRAVGTLYAAVEYIEVQQRLPMGPVGATGPTGPAGEDGTDWLSGSGNPNDPNDPVPPTGPNDIYLDNDTGEVWRWDDISKSWVLTDVSLLGPTGPQGIMGPLGPTGPIGPTGAQGAGVYIEGVLPYPGPPQIPAGEPGDGYIDSNGDLWGWIEGVGWHNYGPIVGPTGPAGPGVITQSFEFNFISDPQNALWARQLITHNLLTLQPSVRVLIDYDGTGAWYADHTLGVYYPNPNQVLLEAEANIMLYNGVLGKVILQ